MTPAQLIFRAGLSRLLIGAAALAMLPALYPRTRAHAWVLVVYLVLAAFEQVLIYRQIGGRMRPFFAGIVDMMILTFLVHRLGSSGTVLASLYFFVCALNALVVGLRVGVMVAAMNALAYSATVWAEYFGYVAFAPDAPDLARFGRPSFENAITSTVLVTVLLIATTAVVGLLVHAVHAREAELEAANVRLQVLSERDPLTGLFKRRHLLTRLEHELARARRGHPLAIVMLDLDGFKHINDAQGHQRGDQLLKEIAAALSASTRVVDAAARYGGDEFILILPDTDLASARTVADRITQGVREVGLRFDEERPVTASVGVTVAEPDDDVALLVRRADESAYKAKQSGGDRVVLPAAVAV
jgi:diguanylate cyclase (GGDEF)-like protein